MVTRENPYASPSADPPIVAQLVHDEHGLTVDYENKLADAIAFSLYHHSQSRFGKRQVLIVRLTMLFTALVIAGVFLMDGRPIRHHMVFLGMLFGFFVLVWFLYPVVYRRRLQSAVTQMYSEGRNRAFDEPRRITLSSEFLTYATPLSQSVTRWAAIERVATTDEHIFIYLSSVAAITVPRSAFSSPEDFAAFASRAQQLMDQAASVG